MIIHAVSIHSGGGKTLLDQILTENTFGKATTLICDTRYKIPTGAANDLHIIAIRPTVISRWLAEKTLKKVTDTHTGQTVICFSNLPPAFKLNAKVILYLQNALLLPKAPFYFNSFKSGLRIIYEKLWLNIFFANIDEIWVQTHWMKEALGNKVQPILIKPIIPHLPAVDVNIPKKYDFITVSGSASHKRLNNLLAAWELMSDPAPSLLVITDEINERFENLKNKNVTFKTDLNRSDIFLAYAQSRCLILTSRLESFCLPIYEAIHFNLKLIVPNEKYAKEACVPDLIINPENPNQIQRSVERYYQKLSDVDVPIKILNVNMTIDPVKSGGTGERTVQMSRALSALGHDCTILTLDLGLTITRKEELKGVKLVALACLSERFYVPLPNLTIISKLVKEAEIVHLMGHWTMLNAITYFFIKKFNKKYIVCPAGALPLFGRSTGLKKIYNFFIGNRIIKNADAHFVVTHEEIPQFKKYGVSTEKVVWIPNGIDPAVLQEKNDLSFRQRFGLGDSPFIFYIGRLNPIKGPDLLLQAFCELKNELPDFRLVMAGPDEGMLEGLKKMAQSFGVGDRVHFIGHVSGEIKSQALHAATLMAIPSRLEAMSIVVLEGGVVGLPVLLTDKCGLNDLEELEAGIVVPATVEGIKQGLLDNLRNKSGLKSMGEKLKGHVYENYLWPSVVKTIENHYLHLLNNV